MTYPLPPNPHGAPWARQWIADQIEEAEGSAVTRNEFTPEQEQWLQALESGDWEQGRDYLWTMKDGTKCYCCLGVAAQIFTPDAPELARYELDSLPHSEGTLLSADVSNLLRTRNLVGSFVLGSPKLKGQSTLAKANDVGATFAEIAAYVRKYPWAVFTNFDVPETVE